MPGKEVVKTEYFDHGIVQYPGGKVIHLKGKKRAKRTLYSDNTATIEITNEKDQ